MEQLNQMNNQNLNLSTVTLDDLDTVRENEYVKDAYPLTNKMPGEVEYDGKTIKGIMYGTDESYEDVAKVDVAYGNFLEGGEGEVVLGSAMTALVHRIASISLIEGFGCRQRGARFMKGRPGVGVRGWHIRLQEDDDHPAPRRIDLPALYGRSP